MRKIVILFLAVGVAVQISGCHPSDSSIGGTPGSSSSSATPTPVPTGTVSNTAFTVQGYLGGSGTAYYTHIIDTTTTPGTPIDTFSDCSISASASAATKPLQCVVEAKENDLAYYGLTLNYNVPSAMCSYFTVEGYFFSAFESGAGPGWVKVTKDANGNISSTLVCANEGTMAKTDATCANGGGVSTKAVGTSSGPACIYDYSSTPYSSILQGGKNCCTGTYQYVEDDSASGGSVTDPVTVSWGGKATNCLAGPAFDDSNQQSIDSTTGYPDVKMVDVSTNGINADYNTKSIIPGSASSITYWGNVISSLTYIANYTDGSNTSLPAYSSNISYKMPYYTFTCYDRGLEVKQQIQVMVRKWDENDAYDTMYSNKTIDESASPLAYSTANPLTDLETWTGTGYTYVDDYWSWATQALTSGAEPNVNGTPEVCTAGNCNSTGFSGFYHIGAISSQYFPGICLFWQSGLDDSRPSIIAPAATNYSTYGCRGILQ